MKIDGVGEEWKAAVHLLSLLRSSAQAREERNRFALCLSG